MTRRKNLAFVFAAAIVCGCGNPGVAKEESVTANYQTLEQAEAAFKAKEYSKALPLFSESIEKGSLQADILAETYLKRAICKLEGGDKAGAAEDLSKAEEGGMAGPDYESAKARIAGKAAGS